jgi:hypothetical protein
MTEKPIPFSGEMVRALREGRKDHTRRIIKPQPTDFFENPVFVYSEEGHSGAGWYCYESEYGDEGAIFYKCPYGRPGDEIVLLSAWATEAQYDHLPPSKITAKALFWTLFDGEPKPDWCGRTRSARFIPKRLYSVFPHGIIKSVRAERLQEISYSDAESEGIMVWWDALSGLEQSKIIQRCNYEPIGETGIYRLLWDSLYAAPRPVHKRGQIVRYESYPWEDVQETREYKGKPWVVRGNCFVWRVEWEVKG